MGPTGLPAPEPQARRPGPDPAEPRLPARVKEGPDEAFASLLESHRGALIRFAAGIVPDVEDAKDIVQEALLRAWAARSRWMAKGSAGTYLYRVTRNLALNARRNRTVRDDLLLKWRGDAPRPTAIPGPSEKLAHQTLERAVEAAVRALPTRRREVFVLVRFHGLSHREVADTLEISPQTVANQMRAALASLREALADHLPGR